MKRETHPANRLDWADYGKGLAILLVVICHTVNGLMRAGVFAASPGYQYFDDLCFSFMVPVFFFISGYFCERSFASKSLGQIAATQLGTLVFPYFIWSAAQTTLMILTDGSNAKPSWTSLALLPFQAQMQFWFLYTLILAIGISLLLRLLRFTLAQKLIFAVGFYVLGSVYPLEWSPYNWVSHSYLYFAIGGVFPALAQEKFKTRDLLSTVAVSFAALNYLVLHHAGRATDLQAFGALAGVALIVAVSLQLDQWRAASWIRTLGCYSLEIFCLHSIGGALVRYALLRKFGVQNLPAHLALGLGASVVIPLVAAMIARRQNLPLFRMPLDFSSRREDKTRAAVIPAAAVG